MQNHLIRKILLIFVLFVFSSGCGTIAARKFDPYDHLGQGYVVQKIYGGVRLDWHTPHLLVIFDLPLSLIADTLLLPLTIYEEYFLDHSLHDAALSGDFDTVRAALDAGKSANTTDEYGHTLVMSATVGLHSAMVEELLKRGADGNALSKNENTALFYAILSIGTHRDIARAKNESMSKEKRDEAKKVIFLLKNAGAKLHSEFGKAGQN
jgi:uncharacterized protein YceK